MRKLITTVIFITQFVTAGCSSNIRLPVITSEPRPSANVIKATPSPTVSLFTSTVTLSTIPQFETKLPQSYSTTTPTPTALLLTSTVTLPTVTLTETQLPDPSPTPTPMPIVEGPITYGHSVQGKPLQVYRIGNGPVVRALVGGIHGGYEENTTRLVNEFLSYLTAMPDMLLPQITLYMFPLANPDGAAAGTDRVLGRLNANGVDLNRNWDYLWQSVATHGTQPVSAGTAPFSEPETATLRDFILNHNIQAVIFYHSAMSEVYPGAGKNTSKTVELALLMAEHTGYRYAPEGIPGQITTGDAINWLTMQGITAVEVELSTHTELDWEQNLDALLAFLNWDLDGD